MTDHELDKLMDARNALVVHFSHYSEMNPRHPYYPEDLHRVLKRNGEFPNSCCVLWPGHKMDLIGSIGVLFRPSCANILSVSNTDSGSLTWSDGTEGSLGEQLTVDSFETSFDVADGEYNEWRIQGAAIEGIFVANPASILVKFQTDMGIEGLEKMHSLKIISINEVFSTFPDHRIFTMNSHGKVEIFRS